MQKDAGRVDADFLNTVVEGAQSDDCPAMDAPERFFNRELSRLQFEKRVLDEARNPNVPLLERIRFLSISGSNLDEFYSVRVAALRALENSGIRKRSHDGRTQQEIWSDLAAQLVAEGIEILSEEDLKKGDRKPLSTVFFESVFPVLTPLAIDPAHPFPFIPNGEFAIAVALKRKEGKEGGRQLNAVVPVPHQLDRFIRLTDTKAGVVRFLPLEALIQMFLPELFPGYKVSEITQFRLLRDSGLEVEEEADDLVREFEVALKRRRRGDVIRLSFSSGSSKKLRKTILTALEAQANVVVEIAGLMGVADVSEIIVAERTDLLYRPYRPRLPERVLDYDGDIFAAMRQKDMLLHHPYETFDIVVKFLQQAARDPDVLSIKQTLYRTSSSSPIVEALCEAAENGKSVMALVELKARFDEARNIEQSRRLGRAGAQVVYGFVDWKTHAKLSTVVRREGDTLRTYTHFGTGNYHPITANFYTDLSLFTCAPEMGRDASKVFNYVTGYAEPVGQGQRACRTRRD